MGFDPEAVLAALEASHGDLDGALGTLMGEGLGRPPPRTHTHRPAAAVVPPRPRAGGVLRQVERAAGMPWSSGSLPEEAEQMQHAMAHSLASMEEESAVRQAVRQEAMLQAMQGVEHLTRAEHGLVPRAIVSLIGEAMAADTVLTMRYTGKKMLMRQLTPLQWEGSQDRGDSGVGEHARFSAMCHQDGKVKTFSTARILELWDTEGDTREAAKAARAAMAIAGTMWAQRQQAIVWRPWRAGAAYSRDPSMVQKMRLARRLRRAWRQLQERARGAGVVWKRYMEEAAVEGYMQAPSQKGLGLGLFVVAAKRRGKRGKKGKGAPHKGRSPSTVLELATQPDPATQLAMELAAGPAVEDLQSSSSLRGDPSSTLGWDEGWDSLLSELQDMGFPDAAANRAAVQQTSGQLLQAVKHLVREERQQAAMNLLPL